MARSGVFITEESAPPAIMQLDLCAQCPGRSRDCLAIKSVFPGCPVISNGPGPPPPMTKGRSLIYQVCVNYCAFHAHLGIQNGKK